MLMVSECLLQRNSDLQLRIDEDQRKTEEIGKELIALEHKNSALIVHHPFLFNLSQDELQQKGDNIDKLE